MHLSYFDPLGPEGRRPSSLLLDLTAERRPRRLAVGRRARIGAPVTSPAWRPDLELSLLDPQLAGCSVWTEPALFGLERTLYLVAQCIVHDPRTGARRPADEFIGVFASDGRGAVDRLTWESGGAS